MGVNSAGEEQRPAAENWSAADNPWKKQLDRRFIHVKITEGYKDGTEPAQGICR